jgi:hypothetical protein
MGGIAMRVVFTWANTLQYGHSRFYNPVEKLRSFFVDFRPNPSKGQYPSAAAEGQYVMKKILPSALARRNRKRPALARVHGGREPS